MKKKQSPFSAPQKRGSPQKNTAPRRSPPRGRYIIGRNCIQEVLKYSPERIIKVFTSKEESDPFLKEIAERGIPIEVVDKNSLTNMVESDSHQSFVAMVKERQQPSLKEYLESKEGEERDLVLVLDSITDPQNLGSILRAAECFNVGAVMWSSNRGVDVTPSVTKASVGASELIQIIRVANLVEAAKRFQEEGYWVVTAEVGVESQSLYEFSFPDKTVLILGSEGQGVRPLLNRSADFKLHIPMLGRIDSLNVSQATSVFLSHWNRGNV